MARYFVELWCFVIGVYLVVCVSGSPSPGVKSQEFSLTADSKSNGRFNFSISISSALETGGNISAYLHDLNCSTSSANDDVKIKFNWTLAIVRTSCALEMSPKEEDTTREESLSTSGPKSCSCKPDGYLNLENLVVVFKSAAPKKSGLTAEAQQSKDNNVDITSANTETGSNVESDKERNVHKRAIPESHGDPVSNDQNSGSTNKKTTHVICPANKTRIYVMQWNISFSFVAVKESTTFSGKMVVEMKNTNGYLSSLDYPLWQLYAGLVGIYSFYALLWLIMMAMNWTDLIRIQYWIGAVIALGMVEKCVYFSAFNDMKDSGKLNDNQYVFAQLVSCLKRTLARILVIVVSTGFGIVKPRLGPMLNKLAAVGLVYFSLCALAGYFDAKTEKVGDENNEIIVGIPIIVIDAGICYWIALSLTGTMRALRVRQNLVKLSLYRHFTVAILGSIAVSIVFLVWSLYVFNSGKCVTDWHEIWLKEGFWHILFCFLLLIIMVIWRPSNNAARYAYSPVIDVDTEEMEQLPSDAYEGMRLRDMNPGEEKDKQRKSTTAEDDLKWVEEHIPSGVDAALPSLLDSDEELMTTKFEMSKLD
ncbi:transmembrane protein 87A-like [Corticium candelabrum]|uniref:transmembrane protein 87A-like n=1 Tax=Corticium candelabrum TaxID=121492 RepID=UPI002E26844D|nr:transmembrane protein 87A-like [Corticium candelabrum]